MRRNEEPPETNRFQPLLVRITSQLSVTHSAATFLGWSDIFVSIKCW